MYANTGAFSSMYTMHRCMPLDHMTVACTLTHSRASCLTPLPPSVPPQFTDSPPEIASIAHSFCISTDAKSVFVYAGSEEEHVLWRRWVREAVRQRRAESDRAAPDKPSPSPLPGTPAPEPDKGDDEPTTYGFQSPHIGTQSGD